MLIRYTGKKKTPYTLSLPIPFVAASDKVGEVTFDPEAEVPEEYCEYLLTNCGGSFVRIKNEVDDVEEKEAKQTEPGKMQLRALYTLSKRLYQGKTGKWDALRHMKERNLMQFADLQKTRYGWRVVPRSADYLARAAQLLAVPATEAESREEAQYESRGDESGSDNDRDPGTPDDDTDGDEAGCPGDDYPIGFAEGGETEDRQSA